jgi:hypothetical protein
VVRGFLEECEQPGTDDLLGARRRRLQLGLEDDPGRVSARIARGLNDFLLCSAPLSRTVHTHRTADEAVMKSFLEQEYTATRK